MTTAAVETYTGGRKRRSIAVQPWFASFVGVWFAALFGLCSLALPVPLLERIVSAFGIDGVFPTAASPLGQTARMLLALAFFGIGEVVGLLIGRRLAAKARSGAAADEIAPRRARDEHPDAPPRKPLSADDFRNFDEAFAREPEDDDEIARQPPAGEWCAEADIESAPPVAEQPLPVATIASEPRIVQTRPRSPVATASLDSLGVVQLSERLALAIAARHERQVEGDETFSPAPVDVLLQRARRETAPVACVEPADPEEFVSDHDDIEDETADAPYSSLLDMAPNHVRHALVEADEDEAGASEPIVDIFRDAEPSAPAVAEADPAETERALKAALESLQRISGTR